VSILGSVPYDLVVLEIQRRELKAELDQHPGACTYELDALKRDIAADPWLAERRADWRTARKELAAAADRYIAQWAGSALR
jgi:hypothetical protein